MCLTNKMAPYISRARALWCQQTKHGRSTFSCLLDVCTVPSLINQIFVRTNVVEMLVNIENHPVVQFTPGSKVINAKSKRMFRQSRHQHINLTYATDLCDKHAYLSNNKLLRNRNGPDFRFVGLVNCSRVNSFKTSIGSKVRPRKPPTMKRRKLKGLPTDGTDEVDASIYKGNSKHILHGSAVLSATTVEAALDVIEKRKKSIKAKVMMKRETLLTVDEEQDIHTRADIYAFTTVPDPNYYILPEEDEMPFTLTKQDSVYVDSSYPPSRKKRRRNYGNANCYVHSHNMEDVFDNTKMLPIGTRLLKPQTKLVELVAQAINGSPDGLLQVQQIYTFLQNRYPFFRYMERMSINSWRSSIRHALYQKWFRKIKFDLSYISSKGCYWSINHKSHPKEWTLPGCEPIIDSDEEIYLDIDSNYLHHGPSCHPLYSEEYDTGVSSLEQEMGMSDDQCVPCPSPDVGVEMLDDRVCVPSPVKEQDPILATCAPDWNTDDLCLSSTDSSLGTQSPCSTSQHYISLENASLLSVESPGRDILPHILLGTPFSSPAPVNSDMFLVKSELTSPTPASPSSSHRHSPFVNWSSNWEEYRSSFFSPNNPQRAKFVAGRSLFNAEHDRCESGLVCNEKKSGIFLSSEQGLSDMINCIEDSMLNSYSDTSSRDIDIIEGFTKSESSCTDLDYNDICY